MHRAGLTLRAQAMGSPRDSSHLCTSSAAMRRDDQHSSKPQVRYCLQQNLRQGRQADRQAPSSAVLDADCIAALVPAETAEVLASGSSAPQGCAAAVVDETTTAYLLIKGALDPAKELAKLASQQVRPLILPGL